MSVDQLIERLNNAIQFPGLTNAWTMPIKTRIDMLSTGIKTPVGIKVMGNDLATLSRIGVEIEGVVRTLPGTLSAIAERAVGGNYLDIRIDRAKAARYGINVGAIQEIIQTAVGGMAVTETVEGLERYSVNVRYDRDFRSDPDALMRVLVPGPGAGRSPWPSWPRSPSAHGPDSIKSENGRRTAWVYVDIQGVDIGTYVADARKAVAAHIQAAARL